MNKKVINIINEKKDIDYEVKDNEFLLINCYYSNMDNMNINLIIHNDSRVIINYSGINKKDVNINIHGDILGNNNFVLTRFRAYGEYKCANVNVSFKSQKGTLNNDINENLKAINEDGEIMFMPVLLVDTNEINAEHNATIGGFNKDDLFYLKSKGLSEDNAISLLKKSFMFNIFDEDFKNLIERS